MTIVLETLAGFSLGAESIALRVEVVFIQKRLMLELI
jgi:hypothetical protein